MWAGWSDNDSGIISNAYATGAVNGGTNVGGLVGYNGGCTITNGYWERTLPASPTPREVRQFRAPLASPA